MREPLINGCDRGVYLQPTRAEQDCVHTLQTIPPDEYAISIKDSKYLVWLSVEAVDDLALAIEHFKPEEAEPRSEIVDEKTNVRYRESRRSTKCVACGDGFSHREVGVAFVNPKDRHRIVWIHVDCRDAFADALDAVWEYPEYLLPDRI